MVLPLAEDVVRSLVLRDAAVFVHSTAQSSELPTAWRLPAQATAPSVFDEIFVVVLGLSPVPPRLDSTITIAARRRLAYAEWGDPGGKPLP
jgi:hypothetical protein